MFKHIIRAMSDLFLQKANERITALVHEIASLESQEDAIRSRRAEFERLKSEWDSAVRLYREATSNGAAPASGQMSAALATPRESIGDLSQRFLAENGRQAKIIDIVRFLVALGKLPSDPEKGGANYSAVYTAMLRRPERFEKAGRGEFRLATSEPHEPHEAQSAMTAAPLSVGLLDR